MATRRKPGLWHSARKVEIENVKPSHSKKCCECGKLPEDRRLVVTNGSGRHQTLQVYCIRCGTAWLQDREEEISRACRYLTTGEGEVRL